MISLISFVVVVILIKKKVKKKKRGDGGGGGGGGRKIQTWVDVNHIQPLTKSSLALANGIYSIHDASNILAIKPYWSAASSICK
jgi:hypothetical protein